MRARGVFAGVVLLNASIGGCTVDENKYKFGYAGSGGSAQGGEGPQGQGGGLTGSGGGTGGTDATTTGTGTGGDDSGGDAGGAGGDASGGTTGIICPSGEHACSDQCVKNDDVRTCGTSCSTCEAPVDGTATCDGTKCGAECPPGKKLCLGVCVDTAEACSGECPDGTHECGGLCSSNQSVNACGTACAPCDVPPGALQATCDGKTCGFQCSPGFHQCGETCAADDDPKACGSQCQVCPNAASGKATCSGGTCGIACNSDYHLCGQECLSDTSELSCGDSCEACVAPTGGTATCTNGACAPLCPSGQKACLGKCIDSATACEGTCLPGRHPCDGLCVPDNTTASSCGTSCSACPKPPGASGTSCNGTSCDYTCGSGFHRCPSASGCPADDDAAACGSLCTPCPTDAHGTAICQNAACALRCATDYHVCSGKCVSNHTLATCGTSCSACTAPTGGTVTCDGVGCVPACPSGMKICNGACVAQNSACGLPCPNGQHNCSGFCVSNSELANCGTACTACAVPPSNGSATCNGTACGISCNPAATYHACGSNCLPNNSPNSCGTSCTPCAAAPANADVTCSAQGACGFKCRDGFTGSTCQFPRLQAVPLVSGYPRAVVRGMSGNGLTVIGTLDNDTQFRGFRWIVTSSTSKAFTETPSIPSAVSAAGDFVSGYTIDANGKEVATRWDSALAPTVMTAPDSDIVPQSLSADGSTLVGQAYFSGTYHGFIWSPPAVEAQYILSADFTWISFSAVSGDSGIVAGYGSHTDGSTRALWWTSASGVVTLAPAAAYANAISRDGSVIVGYAGDSTVDSAAIRWSGAGYATRQTLASLPSSGTPRATANATNQNGTVTVGGSYSNDWEGVVWTNGTVQTVHDLLVAAGTNVSGWTFGEAVAVSDDGKVVAGNGSLNGLQRGWIARLP